MRLPCLILLILFGAGRIGLAWDLPADNGTLDRQAIAEILARAEFPETSSNALSSCATTPPLN